MFAFLARLALGAVAIGGIALGALTVAPTPAAAVTCGGFTFTLGTTTISNCSEIITFTGSSASTLTFNVTFPSAGNPFPGDGYNNSNNVLVGVVNNSLIPLSDLYVDGTLFNEILLVQSNESLCAGTFSGGISVSCGSNGTILGTGGNVTFQFNTGVFSSTPFNFGDILFGGNLPSGDTAIFALQELTCGAAAGAPGLTVTNGCLEPSGPISVPEPGSFAVFGTGLLGFALYYRRRRRAAARL